MKEHITTFGIRSNRDSILLKSVWNEKYIKHTKYVYLCLEKKKNCKGSCSFKEITKNNM